MLIKTKTEIKIPQNKVLQRVVSNDNNQSFYELLIDGKVVKISSEEMYLLEKEYKKIKSVENHAFFDKMRGKSIPYYDAELKSQIDKMLAKNQEYYSISDTKEILGLHYMEAEKMINRLIHLDIVSHNVVNGKISFNIKHSSELIQPEITIG